MAHKPAKRQADTQHVRQRAFAAMPTTVGDDGRSFDVTIYTETPCRTFITDPRTGACIEADEVLLASGLDLSQSPRMPLVNNHDSWGDIRTSVLGRIDDVRAEGQTVVGRATLSNLHADLAKDIVEGFLGNISATYYADQYEMQDREGDVPLAVAHRTVLIDGSMVPVGADPNASVRSQRGRTFPAPKLRGQTPQETSMDDLETAIEAAEQALAAVDAAIETAGDSADAAILERAAKLRAAPDDKQEGDGADAGSAAASGDGADAGSAAASGDGAALSADEQKKEDDAIRGLRSVAASYDGMTKVIDDLVKLGARSAEIKAAVKQAVLKRGTAPASTSATGLKPQTQRPADDTIDTRSIYARRNGRA